MAQVVDFLNTDGKTFVDLVNWSWIGVRHGSGARLQAGTGPTSLLLKVLKQLLPEPSYSTSVQIRGWKSGVVIVGNGSTFGLLRSKHIPPIPRK